MNKIQLNNITLTRKQYKEKLTIFENANLEVIGKDKIILIYGPSGSGKSTILNIIFGILYPEYGDVYINGYNMNKINADLLSKYRSNVISLMFQNFPLVGWLTCKENILLSNKNINKDYLYQKLKQLDILNAKNTTPNKLSIGQKQRVAILQSIMKNVNITLLDEPTSALGHKYKFEVMKLLKEYSKKNERMIIIATHDNDLKQYADVIYKLKDKKIYKSL